MSMQAQRERLVAALGPVLESAQLDLEDLEVSTAGRRRLVRVVVDKDNGVSLDEIADATRLVSRVLDDEDLMDEHAYTLEVTSPGTDRPLTLPRHWRRSRSRLVKVRLDNGSEPIVGRILDSDDERVRLDVDGSPREIAFGQVARAVVQVEFNRRES